jgi:translocator protein
MRIKKEGFAMFDIQTLIPIFTIFFALVHFKISGMLSTKGMAWYKTLTLPAYTPASIVFFIVWALLYALMVVAFIDFWQKYPRGKDFFKALGLFFLQAATTLLWSWGFWVYHSLTLGVGSILITLLTVIYLIILLFKYLNRAALLLIPYAVWLAFALYLAIGIWRLN